MLAFFQEYQTFFQKVKQKASQDDKSRDKSVSRYGPLISISLHTSTTFFVQLTDSSKLHAELVRLQSATWREQFHEKSFVDTAL